MIIFGCGMTKVFSFVALKKYSYKVFSDADVVTHRQLRSIHVIKNYYHIIFVKSSLKVFLKYHDYSHASKCDSYDN